jgi:hypothetical protein
MSFNRSIGFLLLGIWLILVGIQQFISLGDLGLVMNILALASGILIIINR